jgi:threonine/homoserine/homoserine lactone efflux protein
VALFSVGLASLHAAESFLWFLALTGAACVATRWLAGSSVQRMINRITGAVFVAIGVKLVLSRR